MAKVKNGGKAVVSALERSPSHLLHRALQLALDLYADEFKDGGITQRQYAVLAAVAAHEGATQTEVVRITGIDRSTLADMAARMIAKGLLERERSSSDARANAVRLTEAGRAALEDAGPKVASVDARLLKLISGGGRREAFVRLLRDLIHAGDRAGDRAAAGPQVKAPKGLKPVKTAKTAKAAKTSKPAKAAKAEAKKKKKKAA